MEATSETRYDFLAQASRAEDRIRSRSMPGAMCRVITLPRPGGRMAVESQNPQGGEQTQEPAKPKTPAQVRLDAEIAWRQANEHLTDAQRSAEIILNQFFDATVAEHTSDLLNNLHILCEPRIAKDGEDPDAQTRRLLLTVRRAIERAALAGISHQMRLRAIGH